MSNPDTNAAAWNARLSEAVERGLDAFWEVIAAEYGEEEIPAGDVPPGFEEVMSDAAEGWVRSWIRWNASDAFRATFPPSMNPENL